MGALISSSRTLETSFAISSNSASCAVGGEVGFAEGVEPTSVGLAVGVCVSPASALVDVGAGSTAGSPVGVAPAVGRVAGKVAPGCELVTAVGVVVGVTAGWLPVLQAATSSATSSAARKVCLYKRDLLWFIVAVEGRTRKRAQPRNR